MVTFRIIRSWNQTGDKWFGGPDISKFLLQPENATLLYSLVLVSVLIAAALMTYYIRVKVVQTFKLLLKSKLASGNGSLEKTLPKIELVRSSLNSISRIHILVDDERCCHWEFTNFSCWHFSSNIGEVALLYRNLSILTMPRTTSARIHVLAWFTYSLFGVTFLLALVIPYLVIVMLKSVVNPRQLAVCHH